METTGGITATRVSAHRNKSASLLSGTRDGKGDKFSEDQHAEDLGRFIETLAVGPVFLVAHSSGGRVAVKTAQKRSKSVKKLVLMEGLFNALLPESASEDGEPQIGAVRKAVRARFEQGDIDGGLELWIDRDNPGPGHGGGKRSGKDHGTTPGH